MSFSTRKKHEVSDPAYYDPLIAKQKEWIRQNPKDAQAWLELGRLRETKIDMINHFAKRQLAIRFFVPMYVVLIPLATVVSTTSIQRHTSSLWGVAMFSLLIVMTALSAWLWSLRYPKSGSKYFKKAIDLDPDCGEAYMYLGLIALRRRQKRKACHLLEQALKMGAENKRIETELKFVYEKEFVDFFSRRTAEEIELREIIQSQAEQIRTLRSEVDSLRRLTESLNGRVGQAKWEASHKTKSLTKETKDRITALRQTYEEQIADLKRTKELQEEARELAEKDFVRLTTEIMEAKAVLDGQSLTEAARTVEDTMGQHLWDTLPEQARSYLATAEHTFSILAQGEEDPDYSLVGMELCKALETEINRKLVEPFARHLNGNKREFLRINQTGEKNGKPSYFTYLAKVVDEENFPDTNSLTLGQYHFVLERTLGGEYALDDYRDFLDAVCSASGTVVGRKFLKKLAIVVKKYRNAIAHQSPMNKRQYGRLRELIFAGEDALLKTSCKTEALAAPPKKPKVESEEGALDEPKEMRPKQYISMENADFKDSYLQKNT